MATRERAALDRQTVLAMGRVGGIAMEAAERLVTNLQPRVPRCRRR